MLPIIWTLDSFIQFAVRQYKIKKRKKRYQAKRAVKRKKKEELFLSLDAYSRGATDMLEFDPNDDYFNTGDRDLGGKKPDDRKEKKERPKKSSQLSTHNCR